MKKYPRIYFQILRMTAALMMTYRLNLLVQGSFMIVYLLGFLFLINIVFSKTQSLGGWTRDEVILLFSVYTLIWGIIESFFFEGLRQFSISGVKNGDLDKVLTKPVNAQLLISFSTPNPATTPHEVFVAVLFIHQLFILHGQLYPANVLVATFAGFCSMGILFFLYSSYATLAFHFTNSSQALRALETISDNAQYPTKIYPQWLQPFLFSLIPIAFLGYVPTSFLLGRGDWKLLWITIGVLIGSFFINQFAWESGLKKYSSASS